MEFSGCQVTEIVGNWPVTVLNSCDGLFFKEGPTLATTMGDLRQDPLSKGGAQALAHKLREIHGWSPFFRVAVFKSSYQPADGGPIYVVRTNLINGMPPTKHIEIEGPYAKEAIKSTNQAA